MVRLLSSGFTSRHAGPTLDASALEPKVRPVPQWLHNCSVSFKAFHLSHSYSSVLAVKGINEAWRGVVSSGIVEPDMPRRCELNEPFFQPGYRAYHSNS